MSTDFIREIVEDDLRTGKHGGRVVTRFPPEPNGYLHIGHSKAITVDFGIAGQYGGRCNLRFDDTNPVKEDVEYVEAIERDVQWLGYSFGDKALYASDYFEEMYGLAEDLVRAGKAYVDHSSDDEIKEGRGTLSEPGRPSRFRDRTVDDNLALLREMRGGGLPDGTCVLRARIDLAAANMKMRDPLLYRIRHAHHHRTGDAWCIYPMYDYAHPLSDAIEGITHSICTLEFENNRELYDWVIEHTGVSERHGFSRPQQIEMARLNLDYTVMSKRKLLALVRDGHVSGWDDPRMPTLAGMRRRGYSPEALRALCEMVGVAKTNSIVDIGKLEYCVRDDLNQNAPRVLGVVRPLKVTITSWPDGEVEQLEAPYFPTDIGKPGARMVPFARELLIDRDDFMVEPAKDYQRLAPGRTVRLRHGYAITCDEVVRDASGEVVELRCSHLSGSVGSNPPDLKIWGVIHWVSARHAVTAEVRLYDRLFRAPRPEDGDGDFVHNLDPDSLSVVRDARVEPSLATAAPGSRWQLERVGYFNVDPIDSAPGALVLNRIVTLRDVHTRTAAEPVAKPATRSVKSTTRPKGKSGNEYRDEARRRDLRLAEGYRMLQETHGLDDKDADLLSGERATLDFFLAALPSGASPSAIARWMNNELPPALGEAPMADVVRHGRSFGDLVKRVEDGAVTRVFAKDNLGRVLAGEAVSQDAASGVADEGAIATIVDDILGKHADKVAQYRGGKTGLLGFFVGQVVKASAGKADPALVQKLLGQRLS